MNLNSLKDIIQNMSNIIDDMSVIIDKQQGQIKSLIPIGFLYTQLPEQSPPQELWPHMKWTEVTQKYSGLFFRAEGSGSDPFGQIQQANQSWISDVYAKSYKPEFFANSGFPIDQIQLKQDQWNNLSQNCAIYQLKFFLTQGENRPKNTAIKIWKRIQ